MKKLLSILGAIELTATSTTSLIACKTPKSDNNSENGGNKPEPQQPPENSNWKLLIEGKNEKINNTFKNLYRIKINWKNMICKYLKR